MMPSVGRSQEELGVEVQVEHILGTTHFYRGEQVPDNELVGVIYLSAPCPIQPRFTSDQNIPSIAGSLLTRLSTF